MKRLEMETAACLCFQPVVLTKAHYYQLQQHLDLIVLTSQKSHPTDTESQLLYSWTDLSQYTDSEIACLSRNIPD